MSGTDALSVSSAARALVSVVTELPVSLLGIVDGNPLHPADDLELAASDFADVLHLDGKARRCDAGKY